jgi:hypothetical protein
MPVLFGWLMHPERLPDDGAVMSSTIIANGRAVSLRLASVGAFGFAALYLLHRIGQGLGPDGASPAAVGAYQIAHRGALRASEVAVALALLAFVAVPAGLLPLLWRESQEQTAVALGVVSSAFVALGFVSIAAETALINVANDSSVVVALNQLQGRVPVVWGFAAVAAVIGWAIVRSGLAARWVGVASVIAAVIFMLGGAFSLLGSTAEGRSSIFGIGLAIAWMVLLGIGLLNASRRQS